MWSKGGGEIFHTHTLRLCACYTNSDDVEHALDTLCAYFTRSARVLSLALVLNPAVTLIIVHTSQRPAAATYAPIWSAPGMGNVRERRRVFIS